MTPNEWNDWLIGGKDKYLDSLENNLHNAQANAIVQGGKKLTGLAKQIEKQRYEIRGELDSYLANIKKEKERKRRIREAQKRGSRKFLANFK